MEGRECSEGYLCDHPNIAAIRVNNSVEVEFQFIHISTAETEVILKSLDPNKATGHDQIPYHALQDCTSVLSGPMATLINSY